VAVERNSSLETFRARYEADRPEAVPAATALLEWARERGLRCRPRKGPTHDTLLCWLDLGVGEHKIFQLETNDLVWILFGELERRYPSKDAGSRAAFREELHGRMETVRGGRAATGSRNGKASWRLTQTDLPALTRTLDWAIEQLRRGHQELVASRKR
jgi:hypothetical protein